MGEDMSAEPSTISFLRRRGLLTAFVALAACDGDTTPIVKEESLQLAPTNPAGAGLRQGVAAAPGTAAGKDPDYKLGANDRLRITVFGQPTLTGEYTLDGNGVLAFPLIGNVPANGVTTSELQKAIAAKLEPDYLVNPNVSAEVITRRPFFVIGEVQKPGNYSYVTSLTAINAVAMAGGFTRRARKNDFYVRRAAADGQTGSYRSPFRHDTAARRHPRSSRTAVLMAYASDPSSSPGRRRVALRAVPPTPHYMAAEPVARLAPPAAEEQGFLETIRKLWRRRGLIAALHAGAGRGCDRRRLVDALLLCLRGESPGRRPVGTSAQRRIAHRRCQPGCGTRPKRGLHPAVAQHRQAGDRPVEAS